MKRGKPLKRGKGLERKSELRADVEKVREQMKQARAKPRTSVAMVCATCGKRYRVSRSRFERGEGRYCSRACWPRTQYVERLCENCGKAFSVEKGRLDRNPNHGRFCSRACANGPNTARDGTRHRNVSGPAQRARFKSGQDQCVHPDCDADEARAHEHHVVYEQHVRREHGDIYDPRNALRLCAGCHTSHHRRGRRVVPLTALRDENYEFAFELLGPAAFDYLRRRYRGDDERLHVWLTRASAAVNSGISH